MTRRAQERRRAAALEGPFRITYRAAEQEGAYDRLLTKLRELSLKDPKKKGKKA